MAAVEYKTSNVVTSNDFHSLQSLVNNSDQTSRLCYHNSVDSELHKMLICIPQNEVYPVHRHMDSDETITILTGELTITFFDSSGQFEQKVVLHPLAENKNTNFSVLIHKGRWHSVSSGNMDTGFLEIKQGPFAKDQMEYLTEQHSNLG